MDEVETKPEPSVMPGFEWLTSVAYQKQWLYEHRVNTRTVALDLTFKPYPVEQPTESAQGKLF